jgi:CRP-like cAMP-binding protein
VKVLDIDSTIQGLGKNTRKVYKALCVMARIAGEEFDDEDGTSVIVSLDDLGELVGLTHRTCQKKVAELQDKGLIRIEYRVYGGGYKTTSRYHIVQQ